MTTTAFSHHPSSRSTHRSTLDRAVEKVALGLLRWSHRRAAEVQPTHERMALLLENQTVRDGHVPGSSQRP